LDIEELIKAITIQVLGLVNKKVLVFISGGVVNIEEEFDVLKGFNNLKYSVVLSDSAKEVIPKRFIEGLNADLIYDKKLMAKIINEADFILIPVMTRNILAKTALGIRDTFITTGISDSIMRSKKIIIVKDSFDPDNPVNISLGYSQNVTYNAMIKNHIKTIEGFGVTFINASELKKAIDELIRIEDKVPAQIDTSEKVINKEENITKEVDQITLKGIITKIDLLPLGGCRNIKISKKAVITPLAKDYIDSENIKIVYLD